MLPPHLHSFWKHDSLVGLLVLALLFAQWSGYNHRILHEPGLASSGVPALTYFVNSASGDYDGNGASNNALHHSCLAFDAAALAVTIYSTPFVAPKLPNVHVLALWVAFASWYQPFTGHFLSRAPPLV